MKDLWGHKSGRTALDGVLTIDETVSIENNIIAVSFETVTL
jgi:hypothetical protein